MRKRGAVLFPRKENSPPYIPQEKGTRGLPPRSRSLPVCSLKSCNVCRIGCGVHGFAMNSCDSAPLLTAPHDSKARLRVVTTRRRFMAKPCTPHLHCAARAALQDRDWQCNLSLGGSRGGFSFKKENPPLIRGSAIGAAIPTALCAESKKRGPRFRTAPLLMQV